MWRRIGCELACTVSSHSAVSPVLQVLHAAVAHMVTMHLLLLLPVLFMGHTPLDIYITAILCHVLPKVMMHRVPQCM